MPSRRPAVTILLAEDDPDDRLLAIRAIKQSVLSSHVVYVSDGEELLDYLHRRGSYNEPDVAPHPNVILLDLNMPRKDGREALAEIKSDPFLRRIPVVALTTSEAEEDVNELYDLGVNAFVTKPLTFTALCDALSSLGHFWFEVAQLPPQH